MKIILKYNAKLIFSYNALAALLFVILAPIFFDISYMQFGDIARMGEMYLSLSGVFLFVHLGRFEENRNTWELVYPRSTSYLLIYFYRIIAMLIFNAFLILIPLSITYVKNNELTFGIGFSGFVLSSWFLGLLGMLSVELSGDERIGYLVAIGYYYFELATKGRYTKIFQLMGYSNGNFISKRFLLLLCIVMVIIQYFYIRSKILYKK